MGRSTVRPLHRGYRHTPRGGGHRVTDLVAGFPEPVRVIVPVSVPEVAPVSVSVIVPVSVPEVAPVSVPVILPPPVPGIARTAAEVPSRRAGAVTVLIARCPFTAVPAP
jgi:hypothetical protein